MEDSKRLLLNDPDVVAARLHQLEVTQQSFLKTITKMNATITDLKQSLSVMQGHGSTYVRWGRTSCAGSNGELIYSGTYFKERYSEQLNNELVKIDRGYTAGQYYASPLGGPANTLCLPNNPEIPTSSYTYHTIDLYGTEYETNYFRNNSQDEDMPCALCRNNGSSSSVMIPGRRTCYAGWNVEYTGMLAAGSHSHSASNFICVDNDPEYIRSGKASDNGHLMYVVNTKCGSLPCPPYEENRQVYCVVCSK
ncbi:unnamed protein product [Mytilus edulis]|uniref:Uncharacterized protein n=1 Tax=Mytilus edulis TaxID=6550 RepID=A0A8S3RLR9_MYTED|nr:unnamed protein product [Mytilus edulis]